MAKKISAAVFALLALVAAAAGVYLAAANRNADPILLAAPEAAREQALSLMDAVCAGEYAAAETMLYGHPQLGLDREPADPVGAMLFAAYQQSLSYQLKRDCYATDSGIAMDVEVTALDVANIMDRLRSRSQAMLEQRVAEATDISEVYDENGEYLESLVMDVLYSAAQDLLAQERTTVTVALTLDCVYDADRWWILPGETLFEIMGCGIGW